MSKSFARFCLCQRQMKYKILQTIILIDHILIPNYCDPILKTNFFFQMVSDWDLTFENNPKILYEDIIQYPKLKLRELVKFLNLINFTESGTL